MAKLFSAAKANEMSDSVDIRELALRVLESNGGVFSRIEAAANRGEKSVRVTGLNMPSNRGCFLVAVGILRENRYMVNFNISSSQNEISTIDISWGNEGVDQTTRPKDSGRGWLSKLEHVRKGL